MSKINQQNLDQTKNSKLGTSIMVNNKYYYIKYTQYDEEMQKILKNIKFYKNEEANEQKKDYININSSMFQQYMQILFEFFIQSKQKQIKPFYLDIINWKYISFQEKKALLQSNVNINLDWLLKLKKFYSIPYFIKLALCTNNIDLKKQKICLPYDKHNIIGNKHKEDAQILRTINLDENDKYQKQSDIKQSELSVQNESSKQKIQKTTQSSNIYIEIEDYEQCQQKQKNEYKPKLPEQKQENFQQENEYLKIYTNNEAGEYYFQYQNVKKDVQKKSTQVQTDITSFKQVKEENLIKSQDKIKILTEKSFDLKASNQIKFNECIEKNISQQQDDIYKNQMSKEFDVQKQQFLSSLIISDSKCQNDIQMESKDSKILVIKENEKDLLLSNKKVDVNKYFKNIIKQQNDEIQLSQKLLEQELDRIEKQKFIDNQFSKQKSSIENYCNDEDLIIKQPSLDEGQILIIKDISEII